MKLLNELEMNHVSGGEYSNLEITLLSSAMGTTLGGIGGALIGATGNVGEFALLANFVSGMMLGIVGASLGCCIGAIGAGIYIYSCS